MNEALPDPTSCDRCTASLERGWSERWKNNKRVAAVCFDCDRRERHVRYARDSILTTRMLTDAAIYSVRLEYGKVPPDPLLDTVQLEYDLIRVAAKTFETDVWFGGLQGLVRDARYRGHRAAFEVNGVKCIALVWSCAARVLFTLEPGDESHSVTLITDEDESKPVMGIQGICATWQQAVALIDGASKLRAADFARDDKCGVI